MGGPQGFHLSAELWIWTAKRQKGVAIGLIDAGVEQLANDPVLSSFIWHPPTNLGALAGAG